MSPREQTRSSAVRATSRLVSCTNIRRCIRRLLQRGGLCRRRRGRRRSEAPDDEHREPRATALRARVDPNRLTEVIALEPEPTLRAAAERAADDAPVPV